MITVIGQIVMRGIMSENLSVIWKRGGVVAKKG